MVVPAHIWGHALRIWLAAVTALYVAFWLQLGGASSAAVTVAILAQPTRGAALAKAINRIAATFIGAAMSILIAGLFPGEACRPARGFHSLDVCLRLRRELLPRLSGLCRRFVRLHGWNHHSRQYRCAAKGIHNNDRSRGRDHDRYPLRDTHQRSLRFAARVARAGASDNPGFSKAVVATTVSFALAAVSADIVHFYFLTDSQDFIRLAIAIAPMMIFGSLLSVNPKIAGIGVTMNNIFLFLLAPSNPQSFNALSFFSQCMFVSFALCVVFLASRLVWPVSEVDKQQAVIRATKETLAASVTGKRYSLPALSIALASRIADYIAAVTDKHRRHPEVLKGLLATNDLSLASAAAYAHLEGSSDDPAIRSRLGPLQRALQSGNSRRLYAGARSILRRMQEGNVGRQESLLAAVTDLSSAGLLLEREGRRIRHFDGRGSIRGGEGR
jgi:uncharacterized membrane protein YccC